MHGRPSGRPFSQEKYMSNGIVGIRYIGKKDRQEDTVCKTGAVWLPGQVHNFSGELAVKLLVHTDSFEIAPLSLDGQTYLARKSAPKGREVAPVVNLMAMSIEQMAHFARFEFNRVVHTDGKSVEDVRREVHALMSNHNLDLEAERRTETTVPDNRMVPYHASPEEYAALMAGTVVLAVVPAETHIIQCGLSYVTDKNGVDIAQSADNDEAKPLPELLASLEKPELMAFAKQEGVSFSNNFSAEKLREKILTELMAREQQKAA
jgi:hypothetical protein